jgi:hypothetical protein
MQYYENVVENVNVVENYNMDEDLLVMMVGDAVSCVFSENFELKFSPMASPKEQLQQQKQRLFLSCYSMSQRLIDKQLQYKCYCL